MVEPVVLEKDSFKLKEIEKNQIQNSTLYDKKFFATRDERRCRKLTRKLQINSWEWNITSIKMARLI